MVKSRDGAVDYSFLVLISLQINFVEFLFVVGHLTIVILQLILDSFLVEQGFSIKFLRIRIVVAVLLAQFVEVVKLLVSLFRVLIVVEFIVLFCPVLLVYHPFVEFVSEILGECGPPEGRSLLVSLSFLYSI